jgi:hypothetical protein
MLFLNSWRVSSHIVRYDTNLQLFKNSTDTQEKLILNLHSLSANELLDFNSLYAEPTPAKIPSPGIHHDLKSQYIIDLYNR